MGLVHAVTQQSITGIVSDVEGYTIFLQGYEEGFSLAATSSLQGVTLSNRASLVNTSVTITYRVVNGKNVILRIEVPN